VVFSYNSSFEAVVCKHEDYQVEEVACQRLTLVDGKLRHLAYGFIVESYQFQIQESIFQGDKKDKILFEYGWDVSF